MKTELRPTPETDAAFRDGYTFCREDMRPAVEFCANLERERDEARDQLSAMREAINAANVGLQSAMQYILDLPYLGNLKEIETTEQVQEALAKLKPLLP